MRECAAGLLALAAAAAWAGEVRLTDDGRLKGGPVFADRTGAEVIYTDQGRPVQLRLMRLRLADRVAEPVHPDETKSEYDPSASADGRVLAFVRSRANLNTIVVVRDLATGREAEVSRGGGFAGLRTPAVSPDGSRVVYAFPDEGKQPLWLTDRAGRGKKMLIDSPGVNVSPDFRPDGKRLAFASSRGGDFDVYTAAADGSDVRRVTDSPRMDGKPRWSPDGKRLAFVSHRDGNAEVYVADADGANARRVTHNPERDDDPCWHPDGRRLVIVSERGGRQDLYLIDAP